LTDGIPLLKSRIQSSHEYVGYLKERSERLSSVVGNPEPPPTAPISCYTWPQLTVTQLLALLTHEDAATGARIAISSSKIAEAAQRDSSSMKTVAIMTMIFLPGTFFAALFAVPSLDWQTERVVQGKFWVYWAFTLPTTVLVFVIWLLADNRALLKKKMTEQRLWSSKKIRATRVDKL
jgi:hypothetical protein